MSSRLESSHAPLSFPCWMMRILRPIVFAFVLYVPGIREYLRFCGCIAA